MIDGLQKQVGQKVDNEQDWKSKVDWEQQNKELKMKVDQLRLLVVDQEQQIRDLNRNSQQDVDDKIFELQ